MKYEMETMYEIWDERGDKLEVGPDRDGLGLIEIREKRSNGEFGARLVLERDQAKLLLRALIKMLGLGAKADE